MSAPRVIYVHPGEMVEVRIVHEDDEKSAAAWRDQIRPSKHLLRFWSGRISYADMATIADADFTRLA